MSISGRALDFLAAQLGRPTGVAGRVVSRMLNRGNRVAVTGAVDAANVAVGQAVADIGFGGGIGLGLLLEAVGESGRVHGVEVAPTMLDQARSRFRDELSTGRIELHEAPMSALPFADATLDAVISTNTIYFIPDLAPAFAELARVLRRGGTAVLGVGDPVAMRRMPFTRNGFLLRPIEEVTETLAGAGLTVIEDRRPGEGGPAFHLLVCRAAG